MKCKYCRMILPDTDENSSNGMAHTIQCQIKEIGALQSLNDRLVHVVKVTITKMTDIMKEIKGLGDA